MCYIVRGQKYRFCCVFTLNILHGLPSYCDPMCEKQEKILTDDKETDVYSTKRQISSCVSLVEVKLKYS